MGEGTGTAADVIAVRAGAISRSTRSRTKSTPSKGPSCPQRRTYDVTIVAHDLRTIGTPLADSTPMLLRINAVPEPTLAAGVGAFGLLLRRRRA